MPVFDFSVVPELDLAEGGGCITSLPPGNKAVSVEMVNGDLVMDGNKIIAYVPSWQLEAGETFDIQRLPPFLDGMPLVHPYLAVVMHDHPELIPSSLKDQLSLDRLAIPNCGGGVLFPTCRVQTWTGKKAILSLFTVEGRPYFCYPTLDRIARRRACLMALGG